MPETPTTTRFEAKENEYPRMEQISPSETSIPADIHLDEELETLVVAEDRNFERYCERRYRYNFRTWYSKVNGQHTLCGRDWPYGETYIIKATKKDNKYIINLGDSKEQDKEDIAGYNGKYLIGFPEIEGRRERTQIVVKDG